MKFGKLPVTPLRCTDKLIRRAEYHRLIICMKKKIWNLGNWEVRNFGSLEIGKFGIWAIGKFGSLEIGKFGNWEVWKLGSLEIGKLGNLEIWKCVNL